MCRTVKEKNKIKNSLTDNDYNMTYDRHAKMDHRDKNIALLLEQYHYGRTVRNELEIALEYVLH